MIQGSGQSGLRAVTQHRTATMTAMTIASTIMTLVPVQPAPGCTTAHWVAGFVTSRPHTALVSAAAATDPAACAAR